MWREWWMSFRARPNSPISSRTWRPLTPPAIGRWHPPWRRSSHRIDVRATSATGVTGLGSGRARMRVPARTNADRMGPCSTVRTQRVRAELAAFDLAEYVAEIRRCGRRALEPSLRAHAAVLRPFLARAVREGLSPELFKLVRFAQSVVDGEGTLTEMATKRYVSYANLRVLNWVLGTNRHQPTDAIVRRCWEAVWSKLGTWRAYEERTLAGSESWNQADVDVHAVERRIEQLATLLTRPDAAAVPSAGRDAPPREWSAYVSDPTRTLALEHLTVLPQTVQHEEVAFLHTIHISESCFWAMLL